MAFFDKIFYAFQLRILRYLFIAFMFSADENYCPYFILAFLILFIGDVQVVAFQMTLTPGISASTEYTDNLEQTDQDRVQDCIVLISPNLTASLSGRSAEASIFYSPSYSLYKNSTEYDTFRHLGRVMGSNDISKNTRLNFQNNYSRTEEPNSLQLDTEGETETESRGREVYFTNNAHLDLSYQIHSYFSLNFGYDNRIYKNDDPEVRDIENHQPAISANLWIVPNKTRFQVNMSHTTADYTGSIEDIEFDDDYDNLRVVAILSHQFSRHSDMAIRYSRSEMLFLRPNNDYKVYDCSADFNCQYDRNASLSFGIGYFIRDNKAADYESGLSFHGSINKVIRHGSIRLETSTGYQESYFGNEALGFAKYYELGGILRYELFRNVTGELFGTFRNEKWEDTEPEQSDDTFDAGSRISYQSLTWLSFNVSHMYRKIDSNLTENSFKENRFIFTISVTTASPIRPLN